MPWLFAKERGRICTSWQLNSQDRRGFVGNAFPIDQVPPNIALLTLIFSVFFEYIAHVGLNLNFDNTRCISTWTPSGIFFSVDAVYHISIWTSPGIFEEGADLKPIFANLVLQLFFKGQWQRLNRVSVFAKRPCAFMERVLVHFVSLETKHWVKRNKESTDGKQTGFGWKRIQEHGMRSGPMLRISQRWVEHKADSGESQNMFESVLVALSFCCEAIKKAKPNKVKRDADEIDIFGQQDHQLFVPPISFLVAVVSMTKPVLFHAAVRFLAQDGEWKKEDEEASVKHVVSKSSTQSN